MEIAGEPLHSVVAHVAVALGMIGPLIALLYSIRVEQRSWWRLPMVIGAALSFAAIVAAYVTGQRLVEARPELLSHPGVSAHLEYADRLLLPAGGYFVAAMLTGWLNPRTGALRVMLPVLLLGFATVVLVLIVLSGDAGARVLWDRLREQF